MSFILDALRKSEHERQRQAGPGLAELRPTVSRPAFPVWATALGALLAVNLVVLAVLMLRDDDPSVPAASRAAASPSATAPDNPTSSSTPTMLAATPPQQAFGSPPTDAHATDEPAHTRRELRLSAEEDAAAFDELVDDEPEGVEPELLPPPRATSNDEESLARLPTINDVTLQGTTLPELHLDIHVYAAQPAERFVFLNNRKYREGGETPDGTVIERITRDGVVLTHRGVRFLLPRT